MGTEVGASCNARSRSYVDQRLGPPPMIMFMALLMTLSWRFLLILGPERARCICWVAARNSADWVWSGGDARGDTPAAVSHSAVTPQGAGGRRGDPASARVGRPDVSPRGARGGRGGDLSVRVSHPAVTPRGAGEGEGDGVAQRGSGSSHVRRSRRRIRTSRLLAISVK